MLFFGVCLLLQVAARARVGPHFLSPARCVLGLFSEPPKRGAQAPPWAGQPPVIARIPSVPFLVQPPPSWTSHTPLLGRNKPSASCQPPNCGACFPRQSTDVWDCDVQAPAGLVHRSDSTAEGQHLAALTSPHQGKLSKLPGSVSIRRTMITCALPSLWTALLRFIS
jgi:hypothetical protein